MSEALQGNTMRDSLAAARVDGGIAEIHIMTFYGAMRGAMYEIAGKVLQVQYTIQNRVSTVANHTETAVKRLKELAKNPAQGITTFRTTLKECTARTNAAFSEKTQHLAEKAGLEEKLLKTQTAVRTLLSVPTAGYAAILATFDTQKILSTAKYFETTDTTAAVIRKSFSDVWRIQFEQRKGVTTEQAWAHRTRQGTTVSERFTARIQQFETTIVERTEALIEQVRQESPFVVITESIACNPDLLHRRILEAADAGKPIMINGSSENTYQEISLAIRAAFAVLGVEEVVDINETSHTAWTYLQRATEVAQRAPESIQYYEAIIAEMLEAVETSSEQISSLLTSVRRSNSLRREDQIHIITEVFELLGCPQESVIEIQNTLDGLHDGTLTLENINALMQQIVSAVYALDILAPNAGRRLAQIIAKTAGATPEQTRELLQLFEESGIRGASVCWAGGLWKGFKYSLKGPFEEGTDWFGIPPLFTRPDQFGSYIKRILRSYFELEGFSIPLILALGNATGDVLGVWKAFAQLHTFMMIPIVFPRLRTIPFTLTPEAIERMPGLSGPARAILANIPEFFSWILPFGPGSFSYDMTKEVPGTNFIWGKKGSYTFVPDQKIFAQFIDREEGIGVFVKDFFLKGGLGIAGHTRLCIVRRKDRPASSIPTKHLEFNLLGFHIGIPGLTDAYDRLVAITERPWIPPYIGINLAEGNQIPRRILWQTFWINILAALPFFREVSIYNTQNQMAVELPTPGEKGAEAFPKSFIEKAADAHFSMINALIQLSLWGLLIPDRGSFGHWFHELSMMQLGDLVTGSISTLAGNLIDWARHRLGGQSEVSVEEPPSGIVSEGTTPTANQLLYPGNGIDAGTRTHRRIGELYPRLITEEGFSPDVIKIWQTPEKYYIETISQTIEIPSADILNPN